MTEHLTQNAGLKTDAPCANRSSGFAGTCVRQASQQARQQAGQKIWRRLSLYAVVLIAAFILSISGPVQAQQIKTLEDAASEIRTRHEGAQILKAEPRVRSDGSKIFRFRLLTKDGMVKTIKIAPDSDRSGNGKTRKKKK